MRLVLEARAQIEPGPCAHHQIPGSGRTEELHKLPWGIRELRAGGQPGHLLAGHAARQGSIAQRILAFDRKAQFGVPRQHIARIHDGLAFAVGAPLRVFWANWINSRATVRALFRYARARWRGEPLVWLKTEHAYPSRASLGERRRSLKEVLAEMDCLSLEDLEQAEAGLPEGASLGQQLVRMGLLTDRELCEAIAWQQGVPAAWIEPREVNRGVARALPARLTRKWGCVPFQVSFGKLLLASAEPPGEEARRELERFTSLEPTFQLVPRANYEMLVKELL